MGYAENRAQARQLVSHGHFTVNGRRTDIPSMLLRPGDQISVREGSRRKPFFKELTDISEQRNCSLWLERDLKNLSGSISRLPERAEIDGNLNEQLIVEYYSR
jgi:small subunit ribosomal protein S4